MMALHSKPSMAPEEVDNITRVYDVLTKKWGLEVIMINTMIYRNFTHDIHIYRSRHIVLLGRLYYKLHDFVYLWKPTGILKSQDVRFIVVLSLFEKKCQIEFENTQS